MPKLPKPEPHELVDTGEVELQLHQYAHEKATPVLLLHGASACRETFLFPPPEDGTSLAAFLFDEGYEPWLLDWRGSKNVVEHHRKRSDLDRLRDKFDFDQAAEFDIPAALDKIEEIRGKGAIGVVGFCMGGGILAQAIAEGRLEDTGVTQVVLMTLGLFYETPLDGRLKAQDHLLERIMTDGAVLVDPRPDREWPEQLDELYKIWPERLRPHDRSELQKEDDQHKRILEQCDRVSFMYGDPYYEPALFKQIHDSVRELRKQFGAIPIKMFVHAARNVRRGWAGEYKALRSDRSMLSDDCRARFDVFEQVTLITGDRNRIWHRDSIDRMYEWLTRGTARPGNRYRKVIFRENGHQDLLWGKNSLKQIFPEIRRGLPPTPHERSKASAQRASSHAMPRRAAAATP
ncbi:MAG: alpha/beta fold hydrolase [Pseudomonadales bacterium]